MTLSIPLPDGRCLTYAQWGDPAGHPVLFCHTTPGCRLQRYPDDAVTRELGVRLLVPDRPGYGEAAPVDGYTLRHFADDVAHLVDGLGLDTFAVHGMSGGGPFALALAQRFGTRVNAVALLSCLSPLAAPGAFEGMWSPNAELYRLALEDPAQFAKRLEDDDPPLPPAERRTLTRSRALMRMTLSIGEEVFRQGHRGVISDYAALTAPWDLALEDIIAPVAMWHGDADELVPPHHSDKVAARLPDVRLRHCPGETHFGMFAHQREVLEFLRP